MANGGRAWRAKLSRCVDWTRQRSLQSLLALAVGCGGATDAETYRYSAKVDEPSKLAEPWEPRDEEVPDALCGEPFLAADFVLGNSSPMAEVFVDATSTVSPEGTFEAPFHRISDALDQVNSPTRIYVATSEYVETFSIPPGVQLFGGYEPGSWEPQSTGKSVLRTQGLGFSGSAPGSAASSEPAALVGFEVYGSIDIAAGARVVLQGNVLTPTFVPAPDLPGEMQRGRTVSATNASLLAQYNTLHVPWPEPEQVVSIGFAVTGGCARLLDNQLADMRIPFSIRDTDDVVISFNVVIEGLNGIWLASSNATVVGNSLWLVQPPNGCVYGIYLEGDAKPRVRGNHFHLQSTNNVWFDEGNLDADPVELVRNTVYVKQPMLLYIDELNREDSTSTRLHEIEQVNALSDIEHVEDNRLVLEP